MKRNLVLYNFITGIIFGLCLDYLLVDFSFYVIIMMLVIIIQFTLDLCIYRDLQKTSKSKIKRFKARF